MKSIQVPQPITLKVTPEITTIVIGAGYRDRILNTGETKLSFLDFLRESLDQCQELGKSLSGIRKAVKLHSVIDNSNGSGHLVFEDEDYNILKRAIENSQWNPRYSKNIIGFMEAIENAKQEILTKSTDEKNK